MISNIVGVDLLECDVYMSPVTWKKVDYSDTAQDYWEMPRSNAKAILMFKVGCLKFKGSWKRNNSSKFKDAICLVPDCSEPDTLKHVMRCKGYQNKWLEELEVEFDEREFSEYLVLLNRERMDRFKLPIL